MQKGLSTPVKNDVGTVVVPVGQEVCEAVGGVGETGSLPRVKIKAATVPIMASATTTATMMTAVFCLGGAGGVWYPWP